MAIVVIGGLITSTFLSLLVIPVMYSVVDDGVQCAIGRFTGERQVRQPSAHDTGAHPSEQRA
jgi:hypothetical protein